MLSSCHKRVLTFLLAILHCGSEQNRGAFASEIVEPVTGRDSLHEAQRWIESRGVSDRSQRLLIHTLTGMNACCLVNNLVKNVLPYTPADVYVFSIDNYARNWRDKCPSESVLFLPLDKHWVIPSTAGPQQLWTNTYFTENYRKMGHWRLHYPFELARFLGYQYTLQLDDDSFFTGPAKFNLLTYLAQHNLAMAAYKLNFETREFQIGLPELTRYFLTVEGFEPIGNLYNFTTPGNIEGLFTRPSNRTDIGYKSRILYCNCLFTNVSFWYEDLVQRYLKLVVGTGGHSRFRWNEQGVITLIWQLFVAPERFELLKLEYEHPRKCKENDV